MRLSRIRTPNGIRPAALGLDGRYRDLSAHVADIGTTQITPEGLAALASIDLTALPVITGTPAPFLNDVRRMFCIGLNYHDHAAEVGLPVPEHPILFMKACDVTGAQDPIILPKGSVKTDWEVELGFVIGTSAQHVTEDAALDHVAGYFVTNDLSERSFQFDFGGQWVKGKSADSFAPLGPCLVTRDEAGDVQNLDLWLEVNGQRMQTGHTSRMVFGVAQIVAAISRFITLKPGDLVITGTPPGVGTGMKPPRFLMPGDEVVAGITGLGELRQRVVAFGEDGASA
jgi:2,4-didehydro-3-deoxy-L-rhamnonate hydrolase